LHLVFFIFTVFCNHQEKSKLQLISKKSIIEDSDFVFHSLPSKIRIYNDSILYFVLRGKYFIEYNYLNNRLKRKVNVEDIVDYEKIRIQSSENLNVNFFDENKFNEIKSESIVKYETVNFAITPDKRLVLSVDVFMACDEMFNHNGEEEQVTGYYKCQAICYSDYDLQFDKKSSLPLKYKNLGPVSNFLFESDNDTLICQEYLNYKIGNPQFCYLVKEQNWMNVLSSEIKIDSTAMKYRSRNRVQQFCITFDKNKQMYVSNAESISCNGKIIYKLKSNDSSEIRYIKLIEDLLYIQTISTKSTRIFTYNINSNIETDIFPMQNKVYRTIDIYNNKLVAIAVEDEKYYVEQYEIYK